MKAQLFVVHVTIHPVGLWNKYLKEIGPFDYAKGPIFVVKLTCNENFTH